MSEFGDVPEVRRGKIFVIDAPSQTGKDAVLRCLLNDEELNLVRPRTTLSREMRPGEEQGVGNFFVSREEFEKGVEEGEFVEWKSQFGNLYGLTRSELEGALETGKNVVINMEVRGMMDVRRKYPDLVAIFIEPESLEQIEGRMRRNGFDEEDILVRMTDAKDKMAMQHEFDHVVTNYEGRLNDTVAEVARIIRGVIG